MSDSHKQHKLCPSFLVALSIFSVFTLAGIVSAAWVDAPNGPPNYGISGCTYPCLEADFKPMNLSATNQTKQGNISASGFFDTQDPAYFIDPQSSLFAANLSGHTVINGNSSVLGAQLVVNNPKNLVKTGAVGDAIYTYANSTNAALSAEQANSAGYAIYASGGINYFNGDVKVGTAISPKSLCINDDCKTAWPSLSGGIANYLTKWTSPTALGNSQIFDNGTNVGIGTAAPNQKFEVNEGKIRISKGIVLYNTNGPFTGCTAGMPTGPDPVPGAHADVCTCYTGNKTSAQLGGTRCTFNSFMSGGNNFTSCVYSCDISANTSGVQKTVDFGIDVNGNLEVIPSPFIGYTNSNFGGMYYSGCTNIGDANPYTGSCSCPAGFTAHQFGSWGSLTFCYR